METKKINRPKKTATFKHMVNGTIYIRWTELANSFTKFEKSKIKNVGNTSDASTVVAALSADKHR